MQQELFPTTDFKDTKNPAIKQMTKPKKLNLKYCIGESIRTSDGLDLKIVDIEKRYSDIIGYEDILVDANYICVKLEEGESTEAAKIAIHFSTKMKKFIKKYTAAEIKIIESKRFRENFIYEPSDVSRLPWIEFPNEQNLAEFAAEADFGFDIETYGIEHQGDGLYASKGKIRLMQVYLPQSKKAIVWDCGGLDAPKDINSLPGIELLRKKLSDRQSRVFMHNAAFESSWVAEHLKAAILNCVDSMILSQLYWAGLHLGFVKHGVRSPNSLSQVAMRLFGLDVDKTDQKYDYAMPLGNQQLNYAASDAKLTYCCGMRLLQMCADEGLSTVVDAELAAIPAFAQMNCKGVPFDQSMLVDMLTTYTEAANKQKQTWLDVFPSSNPGSPQQVLKCLFDKWGIEPTAIDSKTKKSRPSSLSSSLVPFALANTDEALTKVLRSLMLWRSLKKDCEYILGYIKALKNVRGFNVITGNYIQNAPTVTGRTSSKEPNLQNIPKLSNAKETLGLPPIRSAAKAPPGYKFILVDAAASHAVIAGYVSKDAAIQEAKESGVKLHFFTVKGILEMSGFKCAAAELTLAKKINGLKSKIRDEKNAEKLQTLQDNLQKTELKLKSGGRTDSDIETLCKQIQELYDPAKTVFYGGLNLNGATTLQASFLKKADMLVELDVCKQYVDGGRRVYNGLYNYQKGLIMKANSMRENRVFNEKTPFGTVKIGTMTGEYGTARSLDGGRYFVEKKPNQYQRNQLQCTATDVVSYMWLRTEATIMKKALGEINDYIINNRIDGWLSQFCHDEIMCCIKEEQAYDFAKFMLECMTNVFKSFVPTYESEDSDPNSYIIDNWSEK